MADRYPPHTTPLAIVGMACRLPGADNLDQYWKMLVEGRHAVVELPPDRLDVDMYFDPEVGVRGKTYSKLGAIISSRTVDPQRLPIDPKLAASVDIAHLLMCDVAASALRHAGMDPFNVPLRNTGVYVGHAAGSTLAGDHTYSTCMQEAAEFLRDTPAFRQLPPAEQEALIRELVERVRAPLPHPTVETPDVSASLVAGAINKAFGLNGPYLAINSACASSLQAMLLGARALQLGRVDMAIVGGASDCKSDSLVLFSNARAMSSTGTRPFDSEADGLICGEGYVALVMKTLQRALDDGDKVWAVVRGLGVSSDGKGKSLWAPRKEGQTKAMERAYRDGLDVADLDYVEAHATATKLGDATELNTLKDILGKHFPPGKQIPITSVKANIGHTLETAGIAGVIKAVLAINNETVAPAINIKQLNPNIDWQNSPVYVPTQATPWPKRADGKPRRAGCNAFGIGGLNMHVVVEEFLDSSRVLAAASPGPPQQNLTANEQAIAVIGLGCVLPGAENPQAFWNLLAAGTDPKISVPKDRWQPYIAIKGAQPGAAPDPSTLVGGFILNFEYDWKRHKVPPKQVQQADPLQFQLLEATDQAMQDAGYDKKEFNRENVGVVVGTEFGGDFAFQLQMGLRIPELERHIEALLVKRGFTVADAKQAGKDYAENMLKSWPALIDETGSFSTSSLASRIGKTWNMMGGAAAIDAGQSSGLAALSTSVDMLLARDCDMMICAAGQRRMGWPIYESLALSGDLAQGGARSPLDANAHGNVPGEGVVVVLLKRLADAQRDGDRIHAVLRGVGAAHDHNSWGKALEMAMERSFVGGTQPSDVAVMELDALGNVATTADELRAVAAIYGKDSRQQPLMLSSAIGQMGNTQGAVSLVSLLKAILEVSHGELPPSVGMHSPSAAVTQYGNLLSAPSARTAIELTTADGRRLAAVGTCSRGLAYHAVLEYGSRVTVNPTASQPTVANQSQTVAQSPAAASTTAAIAMVDTGELEKFLVNFVVEQTGYPPEVVELDADLEADLGIDSIKKAQMFGELQEYFDVTPTDNMTLDDFPTLRHIVNFLAKAPTKPGAPVTTASVPAAQAAPAPAPTPIARQVTQAVDAAMQPTATAPATATATSSVDLAELEKFLINFVVEQTGYPPEVVELDADLEADLGIDSIKKAQMFGELQEYFDVTPTEGMTLDDFPTLRHIVTFLAKAPTKQGAPVTTAASAPQTTPTPAPAPVAPRPAPAPAPSIAATVTAPAAVAPTPAAKAVPQPAISATADWQVCRFGAADAATLRAAADAGQHDTNAFRTSTQRRFTPQDRFRLAIVADGAATLSARLATAAKQMDNAAAQTVLEQQGIFYREANPDTRIAFLFPGQGSQYTGMLRQLVEDVPAVKMQMAEIDVTMKRLGFPTWAQLAWDEASPLGRDVWTTQISILLGDVLMLAGLRARGIQPDLVAGHSYGEYPALFAASAWDLEQAIRVTRHRCQSIDAFPSGETGMLATTATPQTIEGLAARLSGPAYVANHNAPDQTVVGGTLAALAELEPLLQAGLFETRRLQVPSAFHTPLMREAAYQFERAIDGETYLPPRVKTYSVANNEPISDPKQIGKNLVAHLTTPVRYADLIRKLASQAPTVFVEVGPQQALSRLNRRILPSHGFAGIASDNPARPGVEQLVRVQALVECSGALDRPRTTAAVTKAIAPATPGQIWHFDATARRRDKMRAAASKGTNPATAATRPAPQQPAPTPAPAPISQASVVPAPVPAPAPVATAPKQPAAPATVAASTAPAVNLAELEKFLINFVVEQTGYPPEVVELDADLEADLGIDSIKKAQMFGELQEYFDVTPTDNMTLDDFPTLRHIVTFLSKAPTKPGAPVAATPMVAPTPAPVAQQLATASVAAQPQSATGAPSSSVDLAELEQFLVNFVVEQTGYPPEVVELDADLEADLGIDSIKKAQMFGELQEYFDVTPTDNLTLDDFPTLRHIVSFLAKAPTKQGAPVSTPASAPQIQSAPAPVAQPTAAVVEAPKPQASPAAVAAPAAAVNTTELEQFLINFVVEQTGYPPEVIELDADLEADLGIDSIKKAQMFGELQEYFDVTPTDNLTLDDFPTLRHIVNFLAKAPAKGSATAVAAVAGESVSQTGVTAAVSGPTAVTSTIDMLHVRGTPYELGYQHGAEKKTGIRRLLRRIADLTDGDWNELPIPPGARSNPERFFTPNQLEELRGMADAVEVPLGNLAALNLAVLPDFAASAAQVALVTHAGSQTQVLHGLAGELSLPLALAEMLTPLVLVREPAQGWACATVTFAGIIGSLVGLNGNGLAASTGTLVDTAASPNGNAASSTVRVDGLLQRNDSLEHATEGLRQAHASRGWTACLSHQGQNRVAAAEHDGRTFSEHGGSLTVFAANHCVLNPGQSAAPAASAERFNWLKARLASAEQPRDAGELLSLLGQVPSHGSLKLVVVVDAARGDLLIECGTLRERVHVGALLPSVSAGSATTFQANGSYSAPVARQAPVAPVVQPLAAPTSADLKDAAAVDPESARFVLRAVATPWTTRPADFPVWKGAVAIQGENALADALATLIVSSGGQVVRLQETSSTAAAVAELEQVWKQQPLLHLFLTTHRDERSPDRVEPAGFEQIYNQKVLLPYFLCQRQMQLAGDAKLLNDSTIVAATDLGGDFGFSGNVATPESGFLTGLMKSLLLEYQIMREQKGFLAKAIDSPRSESPIELAANICRELAHGTNDYEASFVGGTRYLQVALPIDADMQSTSAIRPGGTWVLTGGARGITAESGLELAKRFGLTLHLIGTTPAGAIDPSWRDLDAQQTAALRGRVIIEARKNGQKPNEAWGPIEKVIEIDRNLRAFAAAGVSATYHACNVADRAALARVLDDVRRQDGPIDGILHGAGIEQSCRFEKKTQQSVQATLGAKTLGAYHLMSLTTSDPIKHFIGFGSISGRLGSNGQTDYSAASDMLCKLISWYRVQRPDCHAVGFHFHPWDAVGMAARPDTEAILKASKLRLMPKHTGLQHLLRELYSRPAETELMITDREYHGRYYGTSWQETAKRDDLLGAPGQAVPQVAKASTSAAPAKRIADRVLLRMSDAPLSNSATLVPLPTAVFLLGHNADADALAATLTSRGVRVERLPAEGDSAAICATLERIYEQTPIRCLVLATARDPQATKLDDQASIADRVQRGVYLPYWVTRRWYQLVSKTPEVGAATVVALTSLGGDFGFSGPVPSPEGGSFTGLLKSIFVEDARYEHNRFRVKVIDAPVSEPPSQLAEAVCQELAGSELEVEVAWSGGKRQVVAVSREPVEKLSLGELPRGGVWVITGGARGITAATALELGQRYGLKLHLLGKSPAPEVNPPWRNCTDEQLKAIKNEIVRKATQEGRSPTDDWDRVRKDREIQESLDKFVAAGVSATYHACDVADWDDIDRVLKNIRAAAGPISGVVHGAGYAKSFRFGTGVGNKLEATIAPKFDGTLALMHLTASDPLKYFVGFGSLSGRFGGNGLSDYAAANDALAKLCGWFRGHRPECHTVCFHWQTWDAVGMALLADGVGITKNAFKMDFIPPEEGVNHLIDELRAGTPESEVLITDGFFQRQFYPYDFERPASKPATSPAQAPAPAQAVPPAIGKRTDGPLIDTWEPKSVAAGIARITFDPVGDPFLTQHLLKQKPFLPGVVGLESLVEAARCAIGRDEIAEIRNVRISNGMAFPSGSMAARVEVAPSEGGLACRLLTEQRDRRGRLIDANRLHVEGLVPAASDRSPLTADPPGIPPLGWFPHTYPDDGLLFHGPGFRCLKAGAYQYDGGWGQIVAPPLAELAGTRGGEGWIVPISVLDGCLVVCGSFVYIFFGGIVEVPYEFERLRIARRPRAGENCVVRMLFRGRDERHSNFDFTLYGEGDEPLLKVDGYRTIRVGAGGR